MPVIKAPPGWRAVKFGDVVRQVKDRIDSEASGLERYVAGEHMDTDDLRIRRWGTIGDGYLGPAFHMRFKAGHVLYGSRRTYLRKVAVADFDGICANTTFVMEPNTSELLAEFLPLVMTTEAFHAHSIQQSKGSVNPYINFRDLTWFEFALPPRDHQRAAVKLAGSARSVIEAFRLIPTRFRAVAVAQIEADWRRAPSAPLGQIGQVLTGKTPPTSVSRNWDPEEVDFVTPGDFTDAVSLLRSAERRTSREGAALLKPLRDWSVLQVCIGATYGKVAYTGRAIAFNQQINALTGLTEIDAAYVASALGSPTGLRSLAAIAGSTTLPQVRKSAWAGLRVPWPGEEQRADFHAAFLSCEAGAGGAVVHTSNAAALYRSLVERLTKVGADVQ